MFNDTMLFDTGPHQDGLAPFAAGPGEAWCRRMMTAVETLRDLDGSQGIFSHKTWISPHRKLVLRCFKPGFLPWIFSPRNLTGGKLPRIPRKKCLQSQGFRNIQRTYGRIYRSRYSYIQFEIFLSFPTEIQIQAINPQNVHSRFDGFWVSQRDHSTTMGPRDLSSTTGLGPTLRLVRNPDIWVLYHLYMAESKNIPSTGAVYIHIYMYIVYIYYSILYQLYHLFLVACGWFVHEFLGFVSPLLI